MALTKQDLEAIRKLLIPLEDRVSGIRSSLSGFENRTTGLEARMTELELRLTSRIDDLDSKLEERFDKVLSHIDGLSKDNETREQEYLVIKHQLEDLEKKCA